MAIMKKQERDQLERKTKETHSRRRRRVGPDLVEVEPSTVILRWSCLGLWVLMLFSNRFLSSGETASLHLLCFDFRPKRHRSVGLV